MNSRKLLSQTKSVTSWAFISYWYLNTEFIFSPSLPLPFSIWSAILKCFCSVLMTARWSWANKATNSRLARGCKVVTRRTLVWRCRRKHPWAKRTIHLNPTGLIWMTPKCSPSDSEKLKISFRAMRVPTCYSIGKPEWQDHRQVLLEYCFSFPALHFTHQPWSMCLQKVYQYIVEEANLDPIVRVIPWLSVPSVASIATLQRASVFLRLQHLLASKIILSQIHVAFCRGCFNDWK